MKEMSIPTQAMLADTEGEGAPARRGNRTTRVPAILEAAIQVFAIQGNAGFTQRRIASDAGIQLRTLQHYFSTREILLHATIAEMIRRYLERFTMIVKDKSRSPAANLNTIIDEHFIVLADSYVGSFALECWSLAEHDPVAHGMVENFTGQFQALLMEIIANISPTLPPEECVLRAAQLVSQLYGLAVFLRRSGNHCPNLDAFKQVTKLVCKALSEAPQ
jgi:AcrR family transcriptional regulator